MMLGFAFASLQIFFCKHGTFDLSKGDLKVKTEGSLDISLHIKLAKAAFAEKSGDFYSFISVKSPCGKT
jgi:hypothetical protein